MQKSAALPAAHRKARRRQPRTNQWLAAAALLCALYPAGRALADGTPDPVLNLMVEKGMITQDEANKVQAQVDARQTNAIPAKPETSLWLPKPGFKDMEIYGDVRTRLEDRAEMDPTYGHIELMRFRYALRLGLRGEAEDNFYYGLRLESSSNPRSTWVTLGTTSSGTYQPFTKSAGGVDIGQIYLGWKPTSWFDITAGKMPNPLYTTTMVWSSAINPEGLAEKFNATVGQAEFFANFTQFLYQDANPIVATPDLGLGADPQAGQLANNIFQVAWQAGFIFHATTNLSFKAGATFYQYYGQEPGTLLGNGISPYYGNDFVGEGAFTGVGSANPYNGYSGNGTTPVQGATYDSAGYAVNQTGLNDLEVLEVPFEVNFRTGNLATRLFGDFAYNLEGADRAREAAAGYAYYLGNQTPVPATIKGFSPQTSQVKAYQIGLAIGSDDGIGLAEKPETQFAKHAWEVRAYWQHVEQYALDPNILDLDYFAGAENLEGIYAAAAYAFTANFIGTFRWGYATRIDPTIGTGGTGTDIPQINPITQFELFQVDLTFKF